MPTVLSGSATSASTSTAATAATAAAATSCGCVARARIARVVPECRIQAAEGVHSCQGTNPQEQELGQQGLMAGRRKLFPPVFFHHKLLTGSFWQKDG